MAQLFTLVQSPAAVSGTGSAVLTCAATASGNPVFAALVTPSLTAFTPPNRNWHMAQTTPAGTAGHVEIWYLEGKYNAGGITSVTFTGQGGVNCRGALAEFSLPSGYAAILDAIGEKASGGGSGATMTVASACGNAPDGLGLILMADFFSSATSGTWTSIAGTTLLDSVSTQANNWLWRADVDQAQGNQSYTSGFSVSGQAGWCAAYASFRAVRFVSGGLDGGEMVEVLAMDPTSQVMFCGGDVEGIWRSVDAGDHWQGDNYNAYGNDWNKFSCVTFSTIEANTVYALVGDQGVNGGFMVSSDVGYSWVMRDTGVQGCGNHAATPPFPSGVARDADRWVGMRMIAQDSINGGANGYIYCVDTKSGWVKRSTTLGNSWTSIPFASSGAYFARCVVVNPNNPKELWAGCWSTTSSNGGVFHCADATVASPSWNRLAGYTGTVDDLLVVGSYLYAACDQNGLYRAPISGGGLASLNESSITQGSGTGGPFWSGIDGYVSGTNHIILASCGSGIRPAGKTYYQGVMKLTIDNVGSIAYTDLTNVSGGSINTQYLPPADVANPNGRPFWRYGDHYANWLGGTSFRNARILIDKNNHQNIYVCGSNGCYRSQDGGTNWATIDNGQAMFAAHYVLFHPTDPNHAVVGTGDYMSIDLKTDPRGYDGNVVQTNPGPAGIESHVGAIDPTDFMVYAGVNQKFGSNAAGAIYTRPINAPNTWSGDIGFGAAGGGNACIGLYAGRDNTSNPKFVVAVAQGRGMYRGAWNGTSWNWTAPTGDAALISASGNIGQVNPIAAQPNSQYIYCFDRKSGIYRSSDYGNSWNLIWAKTAGNNQSGRLALNPNNLSELWVSTTDTNGLYRLNGVKAGTVANGQITVTNITTGVPDPAGLQFFGNALYVGWMATGSHHSAQLMVTTDRGVTFQDAGGTEIGSYANQIREVVISPSGLAAVLSGENCWVNANLVPPTPPALALDPPSLPPGSTGIAYGGQENAHGGTPPYTWAVATGALPAGLSLDTNGSVTGTAGAIYGTPTSGGTSSFTVRVTDSALVSVTSGTQSISVSAPSLTINQTSVLGGSVGVPYSQTLTASNGTTPYTWTRASGTLPNGLNISTSSNNGIISGVPTAYGTFTFTIQVADNASHTAQQQFTINIPAPTLAISPGALPTVFAGRPYTAQMSATGGTTPYGWDTVDDPVNGTSPLPPGLSIDSSSGTITGVSTTPGTYNVTFIVTDATGQTATALIPLQVLLSVSSVPSMPAGYVATADDMNTLSAIVNFLLGKPLSRVHDNIGGQPIGTSAGAISFAAVDIDTDGMHDVAHLDRLTVKTPGWYKFRYGVVSNGTPVINCYLKSVSGPGNPQGAGVSSGFNWAAYVVVNAAGCAAGASGLWPFYLYSGDYLQVLAFANAAGSTTDVSETQSFSGLEFVSV